MIESILLYNIIIIGSSLFVFISDKVSYRNEKFIFLCFSFLFLFLPAAIRYNIGTDYWAYAELFESIKNGNRTYMEFGFYLINKIIADMGFSVEFYFACISFLTYFLLYASLPKSDKLIFFFPLVLICYIVTFSSLRSMVVYMMSIILVMSYIFEPTKKIKRIIILILGMSIHMSILLILIIPFLNSLIPKKIIKLMVYPIIILLFIFYIFRVPIVENIINLPIWDMFKYGQYLRSPIFGQFKDINTGIGMMVKISPLIILLINYKKIIVTNERYIVCIILSIISIIAVILSATIDIFTRIERIFSFSYPISIWLLWSVNRIRFNKIMVIIILIGYFLLYQVDLLKSSSSKCEGQRVWPYVTIFNKNDDLSLGIPRTICNRD